MDRLQQLMVFRRVVETGNITRAARDLNLSQPSVSRLVAELEQRLGVPLLLRSPRGLAVTDAGAAFHAEAVRIIDALDEAEASVRGAQSGLSGTVRLTCIGAFFDAVVMPWLSDFLLANPNLVLEAHLSPNIIDLVEQGIDLAIRFGELKHQTLIARKIGRLDFAFYAAPEYLARAGRPETPEALAGHSFCSLLVGGRPWEEVQLEGPSGEAAMVNTPSRFRADNLVSLIRATRDGFGISLLTPWSATPHVEAGAIVPVLPGWRSEPHDVHVAWPSTRAMPRRVRAVLDVLVKKAAEDPRLRAR
ncbi:LysR family transcriptional regulator [Siccirubricoccus phaeus]|uniref:LysR family transcriptional regulator n=1 Tax=Siccirubricoccus phaeus TaxID=2595053 RepID=UPI0011F1B231|nr:LysR family transcriptional regulator [Siccirubricoccus phaeus]